MKILVDEMPEKAWGCLFCNAYAESPQCQLPGAKRGTCLLYWIEKCPYLMAKENKDD